MFNLNYKKRLISGIVLFLLVFNLVGIGYPKTTNAAWPVFDAINNALNKLWQAWDKFEREHEALRKHWAAVAFKAALHNFLRQLAIDTATWIATGDEGQKPMFITEGWGAYLEKAADQAAGTFILTAAGEWERNYSFNSKLQECNEETINDYENCINECDERWNNFSVVGNKQFESKQNDCYDECAALANEAYSKKCASIKIEESSARVGSAGSSYSNGVAGSIVKFLCEPSDVRLKLKIMGGLHYFRSPPPPRCTITSAMKNWENFTKDKNFLRNFQDYWEPWGNDVGITLSIYSDFLSSQEQAKANKALERLTNQGWKAVKDKAGFIKTPASIVKKLGFKPIEEGTKYEEISTGDIIADAISAFAQTLMGRLLEKWGRKGIVRGTGDEGWFDWSAYFSGKSASELAMENKGGPRKAAQERFAKSFRPQFDAGKAFSVLSKLMNCPDPQNPGPTDCVIDDKFAQAVQQELTVREAIEKGYLDINKTFGFRSDGLEPAYNEGYPYRSFIILRKYRILPVSWELAALWIKDNLNSAQPRTFNLNDVLYGLNGYNGPLLDPNWVLKAPEEYCNLEGYGEHIIDTQTTQGVDSNDDGLFNGEGESSPQLIVNRDKYCADERSCIKEGPGGNCLFYGYCTEEKRQWDFQGEECNDYYNTCQTFTTRTGRLVSYLKNTVDFSNCSAESTGCREYCLERDPAGQGWACQGPERVLTEYCENQDGCEVDDTNDIDQDGDIGGNNGEDKCIIPYLGMSCYLADSHARLVYNSNYQIDTQSNIYLNNKAQKCSLSEEGCHEFIRARPGLGTNLVVNGDLEEAEGDPLLPLGWAASGGEATTTAYFSGQISYQITSDTGGSLSQVINAGYPIEERKFIFSVYAYNCDGGTFGFTNRRNYDFNSSLENSDVWQRFEVEGVFPVAEENVTSTIEVYLNNLPQDCYIDSVQFEETRGFQEQASSFHDYGEVNVVYLKRAPSYYQCGQYSETVPEDEEECARNGHVWRSDVDACVRGGSSECARFVSECKAGDIGCDLYTPANDDPAIPAVTRANDSCPAECVGYNVYRQEATFFEGPKFPEFLIPKNEQKCSFLEAGCSEFTNLDKLAEGGEAKEYYTYLRPCHEVDDTCQTFYTWVGSEETGYQLKAFSFVDANDDGEPDSVFDRNNNGVVDNGERNPADYFGNCEDVNDVFTNPECYEFYSATGTVSYHHYRDTYICSNDCHPYRKTKSTRNDCENSWGEWKEIDNNGDGSIDAEYCLYKGYVPESWSCSASANNCYEYKGNSSNNIKEVINETFESGQNDWEAGDLTSESLVAGGHSLKVDNGDIILYPVKLECDLGSLCGDEDGCECQVGGETKCYVVNGESSCIYRDLVHPGGTYLVSFWAKGTGNLTVEFSSAPDNNHKFAYGDIALSPNWLEYSLGPVYVDWDMSTDDNSFSDSDPNKKTRETFIISGFSDVSYIDNIVLKEVRDYYFLIRPPHQWNVPEICDQDSAGNPAPQFSLGCEEYTSQLEGSNVYLKSFYHLCSPVAVGCEAMIDTFNTRSPFARKFNEYDISEVDISADQMIALVYDPRKTCSSASKGCQAMGLPQYRYSLGADQTDRIDDTYKLYSYKTFYFINDPDKYEDTLCIGLEDGCDVFTTQTGENYYFKDPTVHSYDNKGVVCERKSIDQEEGWYIVGTTEGEPNCPLHYELGVGYPSGVCVSGKIGEECRSDTDCMGGKCLIVPGICPSSEDTCSQYIDPLATISQNLVFNGDFSQDVDGNGTPDGWSDSGDGYYVSSELINLRDSTLYSITVSLKDGAPAGNYEVILDNCTSLDRGAPASFSSVDGDDEGIDIKKVVGPDSSFTQLTLSVTNVSQGFSGRFYNEDTPAICTLKVSSSLKDAVYSLGKDGGEVGIYPNSIYYYLDNSVDKEGCNGEVDYDNGCALFNRRGIENGGDYEDLIYDADYSLNQPVSGDYNDSNLLLKVKPDRTCGQWLACKNIVEYEEGGETKQYCTNIGLCDEVDEQGECAHFVFNERENQNYQENLSWAEIQDKSGFVRIGMKKMGAGIGTGYLDSGFFPLERAEERGGVAIVPNGDFEDYNPDGYPIGWYVPQKQWAPYLFKVINNPLDAQKEGVRYPVSGKSFLKFSPASVEVESQFIDVEPEGEYILTAYLNTLNFHETPEVQSTGAGIIILTYNEKGERINHEGQKVNPGSGEVDIEKCNLDPQLDSQDGSDYPPSPEYNNCGIYLAPGKDWTKLVQRFKVGRYTHRIKLKLIGRMWWGEPESCEIVCNTSAGCNTPPGTIVSDFCAEPPFNCSEGGSFIIPDNACGGNVYLDKIQITPALYVHKDEDKKIDFNDFFNQKYLIPQTCRVYPRSDSLSCSYFDESGTLNIGRLGYCLQYDHYPGNSQQCLLWYPIDLVLGESIKDEGGYKGRYPLYYSIEEKEGENVGIFVNGRYYICEDSYHQCGPNFPAGDEKIILLNGPAKCSLVSNPQECYIKFSDKEDKPPSSEYNVYIRDFFTGEWIELINVEHSGDWYTAKFNEDVQNDIFDAVKLLCVIADKGKCDAESIFQNNIKYLPYATKIVQVVTPHLDNKAWASRVAEGSNYKTLEGYSYGTDYLPFGALVFPEPNYDPTLWDSSEKYGLQPLYFMDPNTSLSPPYQPRAGQIHSVDSVKRLFAESYGVWQWTDHYCQGGNNNGQACSDICEVKGLGECKDDDGDGNYNCEDPLYYFSLKDNLFVYNPPYDSGNSCDAVPSENPDPTCLPYALHSLSLITADHDANSNNNFENIFGATSDDNIAIMTYYDKWWAWILSTDGITPSKWTVLGTDLFCKSGAGGFCNALEEEGNLVIDAMTYIPAGHLTSLSSGVEAGANKLFFAVGDRYWLYTPGGWTADQGYPLSDIINTLTKINALSFLSKGRFSGIGNNSFDRLFIVSGNDYYVARDQGTGGFTIDVSGKISDLWTTCGDHCPRAVESLLAVQGEEVSKDVIMINDIYGNFWLWYPATNTFVGNYISCSEECPGGECVAMGTDYKHYYPVEGYDWTPPDEICTEEYLSQEKWADYVVEFNQGLQSDGTSVPPGRSDPTMALGIGENNDDEFPMNFVSLGFGGELILGFDNTVIDGPGNDIIVLETSYNSFPCEQYPEKIILYAKNEDTGEWIKLGEGCLDSEFDLSAGGLAYTNHVKLVDNSDLDFFWHARPPADGFDVNAVGALHFASERDYCGIPPQVLNIKVNGVTTGNIYINNNQSVNLTFNTKANPDQLPLVFYSIDWGDGVFSASGLKMLDKPNPSSPHSFYHLYNYWDLKNKERDEEYVDKIRCAEAGGVINWGNDRKIQCLNDSPCCSVEIKIKVQDNWGWCNGEGDTIKAVCDERYTGDKYEGFIIVSQKRKSNNIIVNYPLDWSTIIASYISRDVFGNLSLVLFDNGASHGGIPYYYSYDLKNFTWSSAPSASLGNGDPSAPQNWGSLKAAGAYRDLVSFNDVYYFLDRNYYYIYNTNDNKWTKGSLSDFNGEDNPNWAQVTASGMYSCGGDVKWYVLDSTNYYIYDLKAEEWSQASLSGFTGANAPSDWSKVRGSGMLVNEGNCNFLWYVLDEDGYYYVFDSAAGDWTIKGSLDDFVENSK